MATGTVLSKLELLAVCYCDYNMFFFVGIWSWLADKLDFILSYVAGFYKPTILKVLPPFCRITAYATMPV